MGECQPSGQVGQIPSAPPKLQPHPGPQPPWLPQILSASPQQRRRHPTGPRSPPASPQSRARLLQRLPCHQGFPPPSGPGAPPRPHADRFPESPAPLYLSRAAATHPLQQLRLPAWLTRGVAANHPISAPSPGQADQSAVSSGPEAGTESGSGKRDDRRKRLERPFAVCARAGLGWERALARAPCFSFSLPCPGKCLVSLKL